MNTTSKPTRRAFARVSVLATAVLLATPLVSAPAQAKGDDDRRIERTGNCSGPTDWKLKAKEDDGRIEVEGEVDSNRVGQTWHWRIKHNGSVSAKGKAKTAGRSGSFSVERKVVDLRGKDKLVFRAVRPATGEVCRGVVKF